MANPARTPLIVSAAVLALVASPLWLVAQTPAVSGDTAIVSVAGHKMRARTAHLAERKTGQPVVILEGGSLQAIETWNAVFNQIAALAPVVAYDRRGIGQSEFDGEPQ